MPEGGGEVNMNPRLLLKGEKKNRRGKRDELQHRKRRGRRKGRE